MVLDPSPPPLTLWEGPTFSSIYPKGASHQYLLTFSWICLEYVLNISSISLQYLCNISSICLEYDTLSCPKASPRMSDIQKRHLKETSKRDISRIRMSDVLKQCIFWSSIIRHPLSFTHTHTLWWAFAKDVGRVEKMHFSDLSDSSPSLSHTHTLTMWCSKASPSMSQIFPSSMIRHPLSLSHTHTPPVMIKRFAKNVGHLFELNASSPSLTHTRTQPVIF